MAAPLEDITVVAIESWMAAPSASALLADLGANVIKVEPPSGDPMRNLSRAPKVDGPLKALDCQFDVDNRGKRSVAVDLDTNAIVAVTLYSTAVDRARDYGTLKAIGARRRATRACRMPIRAMPRCPRRNVRAASA